MLDWLTWSEIYAFFGVVAIDVVLAGDNAVVVGMAAAGLAAEQRRRAIIIGIAAATVMRIAFALLTTHMLQIVGLTLIGGLLLCWVAWKLWRELRVSHAEEAAALEDAPPGGIRQGTKTFRQAVIQIVLADVSMSLDNVLAVAGTARDHTWVLIAGLTLSVALMGLAANVVAKLLNRYRWIAYVGLALIVFVALKMIWDGTMEVAPAISASL